MDASLTIGLFGPMRVLIGDEPMPRVRSRKALWLMAQLTLRGGRPTSRYALASSLWPDADAALSNLRPVVSELRRALGAHGERLRSPDRESLAFDLDGVSVDVARFDRAVRSGDAAGAVALYSGALLEGCPEEWAHQERQAREADCLKALRRLADDALASGAPSRAVDLYARACALDPIHEEARRGQMAALAATGDVNAALDVYREFAQALRAQIGLSPEPETTALYERLRACGRGPAAARAARPVAGNLPRPADELVGRDDERTDVAALLRRSSLVTLTGPGGIGKTRLALAAAHDVAEDFPDGVWFVALDGLTDGSRLPHALAEALGVRETRGQGVEPSIRERLRSGRALLVLDNCEHLLAECARLCGEIVAHCPETRVLTTSREPLGLRGERSWAVPALAFPDPDRLPAGRTTALRFVESFESVRLFVRRARAIAPDFELGPENVEAVAAVCARLEGVPLAIELAAAQTRAMDVAQIADRLDDSLRLLTAGFRARLGRQRTLRATLDWSYGLLENDERDLLGRLSVFVDGWPLEAAQALAEGDGEGPLGALVDKSLVGFDLPTGRYRLLETVRQYASEKLSATDEGAEVRRRRAGWCLDLAERGERALAGSDPSPWLDRLQRERANLLAAASDLEADPRGGRDGLRLAVSLARFWHSRGPRAEGIGQLRRALSHPGAQEESLLRVRALNALGTHLLHAGSPIEARPCYEAAVALGRRIDARAALPNPLTNLGSILLFEGDHAGARRLYEECLAIHEAHGNRTAHALSLINLANLLNSHLGEAAESREVYERALPPMREAGAPQGIAAALEGIGYASLAQGDYDAASACQREALSILESLGDQDVAWSLFHLGEIAHARGEISAAFDRYDQSLGRFAEAENHDGMARAHQGRAKCLLERDEPEAARAEFETALRWHREVGRPKSIGEATVALALAETDLGRRPEAAAQLVEALDALRAIEARRALVTGLDAAAGLLAAPGAGADEGDPWLAVRLWAAGEEERRRTGSAARVPERERNRKGSEAAKARLGASGFAAAWRGGAALALDDAAAEASQAMSILLRPR